MKWKMKHLWWNLCQNCHDHHQNLGYPRSIFFTIYPLYLFNKDTIIWAPWISSDTHVLHAWFWCVFHGQILNNIFLYIHIMLQFWWNEHSRFFPRIKCMNLMKSGGGSDREWLFICMKNCMVLIKTNFSSQWNRSGTTTFDVQKKWCFQKDSICMDSSRRQKSSPMVRMVFPDRVVFPKRSFQTGFTVCQMKVIYKRKIKVHIKAVTYLEKVVVHLFISIEPFT